MVRLEVRSGQWFWEPVRTGSNPNEPVIVHTNIYVDWHNRLRYNVYFHLTFTPTYAAHNSRHVGYVLDHVDHVWHTCTAYDRLNHLLFSYTDQLLLMCQFVHFEVWLVSLSIPYLHSWSYCKIWAHTNGHRQDVCTVLYAEIVCWYMVSLLSPFTPSRVLFGSALHLIRHLLSALLQFSLHDWLCWYWAHFAQRVECSP